MTETNQSESLLGSKKELNKIPMMTIKEIVDLTRCSDTSVRNKIKKIYPNLIKNGEKTLLSQEQAYRVCEELRKVGYVQLNSIDELVSQKIQEARKIGEVKHRTARKNGEVRTAKVSEILEIINKSQGKSVNVFIM